tara:strand:+ start:7446 stop:7703 length:258 start_codon:yes stop_codon:yes gene_type:complete
MNESFNCACGKKIRSRRLTLGLTQSNLAESVGVTFQQIQKYEKGTNGVSAERLGAIATALKVNVLYFYNNYKPNFVVYNNDNSNS